jgi:hypothetical protein
MDVAAILANEVNVSGRRISIYIVEGYYQMWRSDVGTSAYAVISAELVASITNVPSAASISATASNIKNIRRNEKGEEDSVPKHMDNSEAIPGDYKQQQEPYKEHEEDELVEGLNRLTDRSKSYSSGNCQTTKNRYSQNK